MSKLGNRELKLKSVRLVGTKIPKNDSGSVSIGDEEGTLVVVNESRKVAREMLHAIDSCLDKIPTQNTMGVAEFINGEVRYVFEVFWYETNDKKQVEVNGRGYLPDGSESGDDYENDVMADRIDFEDWKTLVAFV